MPLHPPAFTANAPARSGQNTRDSQVSGGDTAEPLDVFPQYSEALRQVINHRHALQQTQAREMEDGFDINPERIHSLNPDNPYRVALEPLDFNDLQLYRALGMAKPCAETRHAAELLAMGESDFALIDAVRDYVAFEMGRHADGADTRLPWTTPHPSAGNMPVSAALRCAGPDMDGVLEVQDFDNFQIITYTPVPAAHPAPPRHLQWMQGWGALTSLETDSENQVVLCASNAEDAQPPGWALG